MARALVASLVWARGFTFLPMWGREQQGGVHGERLRGGPGIGKRHEVMTMVISDDDTPAK